MARREGYDREAYIQAVRAAIGERSQIPLAMQIGCSQGYLSAWLQGRVPARAFLERLAEVTGTDPNALLVPAGYAPVSEGSPGDWFLAGVRSLAFELGRPLMVSTDDMPGPGETREQVRERLERLRRRVLDLGRASGVVGAMS